MSEKLSLKSDCFHFGTKSNGHEALFVNNDTNKIAKSGNLERPYSDEDLNSISKYISNRTKHRPVLGIICGSGLGGLADILEDGDIFPYETIPNFPRSTVSGHAGRLVVGLLNEIPVICMQGRFHAFEGYTLWKVTMPVRVMKLLGVETLIVTNAAGGLNPHFNIGDIMIIKDHINMLGLGGRNVLEGVLNYKTSTRTSFQPLKNCYDSALRLKAHEVASELKYGSIIREGVYVMVGGPSFETPAELKILQEAGVDAVGMSTVPEVLVAHHCGMKVFAFSLITNECITELDSEKSFTHLDVLNASALRETQLKKFISALVTKLVSK